MATIRMASVSETCANLYKPGKPRAVLTPSRPQVRWPPGAKVTYYAHTGVSAHWALAAGQTLGSPCPYCLLPSPWSAAHTEAAVHCLPVSWQLPTAPAVCMAVRAGEFGKPLPATTLSQPGRGSKCAVSDACGCINSFVVYYSTFYCLLTQVVLSTCGYHIRLQ